MKAAGASADAGEGARGALCSLARRDNLVVCVAVSLSLVSTWLLNVTAYPGFNAFFPAARDIATSFGALAAFVFALLAMWRPRILPDRRAAWAAGAGFVVADLAMFAGIGFSSPVLACAGSCLRSLVSPVLTVCLGMALVGLGARARLPVLIAAFLLKYVWMGALWFVPYAGKVAAFVLLPLAALALAHRAARPVRDAVSAAEAPATLAITNPLSFLPFTHRLFVAILMFQAGFGFAATYGSTDSHPLPFIYSFAVLAAFAALTAARPRTSMDTVYGIAYVLVLAGLLLVPASLVGPAFARPLANMLLQGASDIFDLAIWYLLAAMGARNVAGAVPLFLVRSAAACLGTELGAASGHAVNLATQVAPELTTVLVGGIVLVFASYNFFLARKFSFDRTVEGVEPMAPLLVAAYAQTAGALAAGAVETEPAIDRACEGLVADHGLTVREAQVLRLLARGRNVAFIQEDLVLSRNTVKSYIASVYRKLDVHSHQEVIDLVEERLAGQAPGRGRSDWA